MAIATNQPSTSSKPRVTTRMTPAAHAILEDAAAFLGVPLNSFIVSAAIEKASEVLAKERLITLTPRDAEFVAARMDKPGKPSRLLLKTMKGLDTRVNE